MELEQYSTEQRYSYCNLHVNVVVVLFACRLTRLPEQFKARSVHLLAEHDLVPKRLGLESEWPKLCHVTQYWIAELDQKSTSTSARAFGHPPNASHAEAHFLVKRVRCAEPDFAAAFDASLNFSLKASLCRFCTSYCTGEVTVRVYSTAAL